MSRPKWPHLENLHKVLAEDPNFFDPNEDLSLRKDGIDRYWTITEKVHGFNARFGLDEDGVPWAGGRNEVVAEGDPESWDGNKLQGFIGYAAQRVGRLHRGETVFGEWAGKGVQKGIDYGDKDFYAFGLMYEDQLCAWSGLELAAPALNMKLVPVLYEGYDAPQPEALINIWRSQTSRIAKEEWEGVVVSAYPPKVNKYGGVTIVKVKSPRFAETAFERRPKVDDAERMRLISRARGFAEDYVTEERLAHVLQQVAEHPERKHDDPLDVTNTGLVFRLMYQDIVREGSHEYEKLNSDNQKAVGKIVNEITKPLLTAARDLRMLA